MKRRRNGQAVHPALREVFAAADAMTASGQEPHKHHVVPRFYLDRWAENDRVMVTDLDARKSHQVQPKNALIETDFYRVPAGTMTGTSSPVVWESWLSSVEGNAARAFDQFDKGGVRSLDQEALAYLGFFISVQATRSRFHRYEARWNASVGVYRALQLDQPGAIAAQLESVGEDPTPERIAEIEAYFGKINANPWKTNLSAAFEMDLMQRSAFSFNELLTTRNFMVYETDKPLLTGDEPVVALWERMGDDHLQDGGWFGTPILAFPMDPHHVAAFFRSNMPLIRGTDAPLDWRETLELNRTIAGNSFRNAVSQPSNLMALKLLVPEAKEPMQMKNHFSPDGQELIRWRVVRRWTDEAHAPIRPVASWWPAVVPPAPSGPMTKAEWDEEKRKWDEI